MHKNITAISVLAAFLWAAPAHPSAGVADQSDLWWNAAESGWGMQLAHRGGVIFVTMYAYDAQGKPTWATAVLRPAGPSWTGDVYLTTGPFYGAATFDPAAVTRRVAGSMTWTSADAVSGTIAYSIDGVSVTKKVVRQTLENDDFAGRYLGALSWVNSCTGLQENVVDLTVTQVGANVSVNWTNQATRDACFFSGVLEQDGQFGSISGSFQCSPVHDDGEFEFLPAARDARVDHWSLCTRATRTQPARPPGTLSAARRR